MPNAAIVGECVAVYYRIKAAPSIPWLNSAIWKENTTCMCAVHEKTRKWLGWQHSISLINSQTRCWAAIFVFTMSLNSHTVLVSFVGFGNQCNISLFDIRSEYRAGKWQLFLNTHSSCIFLPFSCYSHLSVNSLSHSSDALLLIASFLRLFYQSVSCQTRWGSCVRLIHAQNFIQVSQTIEFLT